MSRSFILLFADHFFKSHKTNKTNKTKHYKTIQNKTTTFFNSPPTTSSPSTTPSPPTTPPPRRGNKKMFAMTFTPGGTIVDSNCLDTPDFVKQKKEKAASDKFAREKAEAERLALLAEQAEAQEEEQIVEDASPALANYLGDEFQNEMDDVEVTDATILSRSSLSPQKNDPISPIDKDESSLPTPPMMAGASTSMTPPPPPVEVLTQTSFGPSSEDVEKLMEECEEAKRSVVEAEEENRNLVSIIDKRVTENAELHERIASLEKLASSEIKKVQNEAQLQIEEKNSEIKRISRGEP